MNAKVKDFIEQQVIPALSKALNKSLPATFTTSSLGDAFYISDLIKTDIKFEDDPEPIHVLIKRWSDAVPDANMFQAMFDCEILFYTKYAKHCTINLPKLYYCLDSGEDSFLVIENVNHRGFYLSEKAYNLDMDYILASVKELARFHSTGYELKVKKPVEFKKMIHEIRDWKFNTENNMFTDYVNLLAPRCLEHLRSVNYDAQFCDKMQKVLENAFEVLIKSREPVEPLATLCHGDYLRNNILFKKSNDKVEVLPIDFATITYSTPALDLSTFFYMCCSRFDMLNNFEHIFATYCDTLHDCFEEKAIPNVDDFSTEVLLADYKRNAFQGFVIASFFLSIVIYGRPEGDFFERRDEYIANSLTLGGDGHTKLLADMLVDMRTSGCLDRYLT